jgi:F-type H+-transporting ATPase subunit b
LENLGINGPLLLLQIVHFIIVLFLLNRLLYKPILGVFERRKQRIADGLAEAEKVRVEASAERERLEAQLATERRESQSRLQQAVSASEEAAKRRLDEANAEAADLLTKARAEAEQTRANALSGLQSEIADLALAAASKVLGSAIDEKQHRGLVDGFLQKELGDLA